VRRAFGRCRDGLGFAPRYGRRATGPDREEGGRWRVTLEQTRDRTADTVPAKFVLIGAGGSAPPPLQVSAIPEAQGYAGFPASGIWLGRTSTPWAIAPILKIETP
jgi:malate dehydrogenase (quinone)